MITITLLAIVAQVLSQSSKPRPIAKLEGEDLQFGIKNETNLVPPSANLNSSTNNRNLPLPIAAIVVICVGVGLCVLAIFVILKTKTQKLAKRRASLVNKSKLKAAPIHLKPTKFEHYDAMSVNEKKYLIKMSEQKNLKIPSPAFVRSIDGSMVEVLSENSRPKVKPVSIPRKPGSISKKSAPLAPKSKAPPRGKKMKTKNKSPPLTILPFVLEESEDCEQPESAKGF